MFQPLHQLSVTETIVMSVQSSPSPPQWGIGLSPSPTPSHPRNGRQSPRQPDMSSHCWDSHKVTILSFHWCFPVKCKCPETLKLDFSILGTPLSPVKICSVFLYKLFIVSVCYKECKLLACHHKHLSLCLCVTELVRSWPVTLDTCHCVCMLQSL